MPPKMTGGLFYNLHQFKEMKIMYLMYADESGNTGTDYDNKEQPIFVLAGILVEDRKWHNINSYFNEKKMEILPILKNNEIHTNELFNSSKKSIFNQFKWQDNFRVLEQLGGLITELDIKIQYIAIDKKHFKRSVYEHFRNLIKIEPYIYSFGLMYDHVSDLLVKHNNKGIIFLDNILTIPKTLHNIYPTLSQNNSTMIEEAMFLNSKNSNFIQIADIAAFYIEKFFSISKEYKKYSIIKEEHCMNMYKKLSTKINPVGSEFLTKYIPFKTQEYYV